MTDYTDLKARLRSGAKGLRLDSEFRLRSHEKITPFGVHEILEIADLLAAALAAIEELDQRGQVVVTKNDSGCIVAVTRQDDEGRVLSVIAEAAPAPTAEPVAQVIGFAGGLGREPVFLPGKDAPIGALLYAAPQPAQADEAQE